MRPGNFSTIFLLLLIIIAVSYCGKRSQSEKKVALKKDPKTAVLDSLRKDSLNKANAVKKVSLTRDESDFILKTADARMMGVLEGQAAVKMGSTQQIKDYGNLMIKDQSAMLEELKKLSAALSVHLPDSISKDKREGLKGLLQRETNSKKFDRKFVRMMKIDHRRDIKLLLEAKESKNPLIKSFADRYLPLVQSHLELTKQLRKKEKRVVKPL